MDETPQSFLGIVRSVEVGLPLGSNTQLSIPVRSVESAIQLAYNSASGWFKGQRGSNALQSIIRAKNGRDLISSIAFSAGIYIERLQNSPICAVTIMGSEDIQPNSRSGAALRTLSLPEFSSSRRGPPEVLCLRSLTTALLCLFNNTTTHEILQDIIPDYLVSDDSGLGPHLEKQGPFSTALRNYIEGISAEEECNRLREELLKSLEQTQAKVTEASLEDLRNCLVFETPLALSFLSWLLTPEHKRDEQAFKEKNPGTRPCSFPTRSLRVWALAFILGEIGWNVGASTIPIRTQQMYNQHVDTENDDQPPRIFLMTAEVGPHQESSSGFVRKLTPPRRVPIKSIPSLVFDYYAFYSPENVDSKPSINQLEDIFYDAFQDLSQKLTRFKVFWEDERMPDSGPLDTEDRLSPYQQKRLQDWLSHPAAERLFAGVISRHLDTDCPDACGRDPCYDSPLWEPSEQISVAGNTFKQQVVSRHKNHRPWIVMHIVMLAFVYAVACKCLRNGDNSPANENTEIVLTQIKFFETDGDWILTRLIIPDGFLLSWVCLMASFIDIPPSMSRDVPMEKTPAATLRKALYHMICGISPLPIPFGALGCYANGLTLLSKCVTHPADGAIFRYMVQFGRPLEIPVSERGLIIGSGPQTSLKPRNRFSAQRVLSAADYVDPHSAIPLAGVRWDPEPTWERDPMELGLRCRVHNVPRFIINPWYRCGEDKDITKVECRCTSHCSRVDFPSEERWFEMDLQQFYEKGGSFRYLEGLQEMKKGDHWRFFVRSGTRKLDQLLASGLVSGGMVEDESLKGDFVVQKYFSTCLLCAGDVIRRGTKARHGQRRILLSLVVLGY